MYERYIDNAKFINRLKLTGQYDIPVIKKQDIELKPDTVSFF